MATFGQKLREIRLKINFPQARFAAIIGVSDTQYQRYEYDESEPTLKVLKMICHSFNVNANYLLGLSDEVILHPDNPYTATTIPLPMD